MKKIIFILAVVFFSFSFTITTFALVNPPREQLKFDTATKTFSGIFTNSNQSSSIEVLLRSSEYNFDTNQQIPIEYISLGNIPVTGGAFTLPLQNNSAFQQLTIGDGNNYFLNTSSGRWYPTVTFRIPDPTNSLGLNTGFAELYDSVTISNNSSTTTTSNTNASGSNTTGTSSSTTVVPDVIKLSINYSTKKLTGTKTNTVPGATLKIYLYSHLHPTNAAVFLGDTTGASGNFTVDLSGNSEFNGLSVEDGYFQGTFTSVGQAILDKMRVTVDGTTVTKDNLGFTLTNVANSTTSGSTSSSSGNNQNQQGTSTGGQTNPVGTSTGGQTNPVGTPTGGQTNPVGTSTEDIEKLEDPLGEGTTLEGLILKLFEIIMYIGVPLVAFFLIYSGFMFVAAQGNEEKLQTAKSRLLYTIIGAIILLGAWTISQAIKGTVEDIKSGGQASLVDRHNLG